MVQGVKEAVMVQCYNDCPEEVFWVLEQAKVNRVSAFSFLKKSFHADTDEVCSSIFMDSLKLSFLAVVGIDNSKKY
jgi:hypothetical protein